MQSRTRNSSIADKSRDAFLQMVRVSISVRMETVYERSVRTHDMWCDVALDKTGKDEAKQRVRWNDTETTI